MTAFSGKISSVADFDTFKSLLESTEYIVVDCYAPWCGPCKLIAPYFAGLSINPSYAHVLFIKVNVEEAPEIAEFLEVAAMPTFYFFKNGQKVDKFCGASSDDLCQALDKLIS